MWSKLFVLASLLFATGCSVLNSIGPNCDRSAANNENVVYKEGKTENGVYMSSPWAGELLWFPGGMRYEIPHGLGQTPQFVETWLSFDHCGTQTSTVALASGNQAEVREVSKDKLVIINGSCSDYWLLVIAGTTSNVPTPPDVGMDAGMGDGVCSDAGAP
jgi:hypothetical protein